MVFTLFCCLMTHDRFRSTVVVTKDENILIVGLHEITFTGNLLDSFRISVEFLNLSLVTTELGIIPFLLRRQLINALEVLDMTPHAVVVEESYE